MRIIAGSEKGRRLRAVPGTSTRPTSDKVKEAVYNMIGPYFDGGSVLDLYAGTGAMGIEAISRGMQVGIFVDTDRKAVGVIKENIKRAGFEGVCEVYRNDAEKALNALGARNKQFDLVIVDPPYRLGKIDTILEKLLHYDLLQQDADIVVEHGTGETTADRIGPIRKRRVAQYGDTIIAWYKHSE